MRNHGFSLQHRESGVLLHPTSLPGPHGIGDLGPKAFAFVDFLNDSGQGWWQMFPLGPVGHGNSPYQTYSVFAGNHLLISLDALVQDKLLSPLDKNTLPSFSDSRVEFDRVIEFKGNRFRKAFENFEKRGGAEKDKEYKKFCSANAHWLTTYALYSALKEEHQMKPWWEWEPDVRGRNPEALAKAKKRLASPLHYHQFLQYQFFKQWGKLKTYCAEKGVGIIGDIPIFVAHDSADVWANPDIFYLEKNGQPTIVAGVPPDYFCKTGQLWGNPIYRWDILKKRGYDWWLERIRMAFKLTDAVRLDHFIGFYRHWTVAAGATTAIHGKWLKGPRDDFFKSILNKMGKVEFIAEDLGLLIPEVKTLRDAFQFPGMRVLQFAFGNDPEAENYLPHNYSKNSVVYTGTHDNDTTVGWFHDKGSKSSTRTKEEIERERNFTLLYLKSEGKEIHWDLIRLALMSVANTAIIPAQDIFGLGTEARMNMPGTPTGNWQWRLSEGVLTPEIAIRLHSLTQAAERLPNISSQK